MKRLLIRSVFLVLVSVQCVLAEDAPQSLDLRRGVPSNSYLAMYHRRNPERDFQRQYLKEVCDTVRETKIIERAVSIITSRVPEDHLEQAKSVLQQIHDATASVDWASILNCQESVYAQSMQFPTAQHLALLRLNPDSAASIEQGVKNLIGLVEKHSGGEVPLETSKEGNAEITVLALPKEVPFRPTIARVNDVLLFSTSEQMARDSLAMLLGTASGVSKFDDPRLKEALAKLPEPEDSLVFYDGKQQFSQLREMGQFIRQMGRGDEDAQRAALIVELIFDELSFLDYEITVEYTEENRNRTATLGRFLPGAENKVLTKVFGSGEPFENWHQWVPADATAYSLSSGANLHPAYEWAVKLIDERFPEAQEFMNKFDDLQDEYDVHLDEDILQAFSGETISVSFPAEQPAGLAGQDFFMACRCQKPERIKELLHRLVERLQAIPFLQAQQLELKECEDLEGFEELSAAALAVFGARPVIGFRDGWMIIGSKSSAVQKVLDTRAGKGETIADTDAFKQFHLEVDGAVNSISYTNLAESTRRIAMLLNQVGAFVPAIIGMAGAQADPEDLKPVQELLGLLPSVAKIVEKFDYLEAKLSVTQPGDNPQTYLRRAVTLVRPPTEDAE